MQDAKMIYKRLDALKAKRQTFDQHWQEIGDYVIPNKNTITRESYPGEKRNLHLYDGTAIQCNELLAGMLHGVLTNPAALWFEFTTGVRELDKVDSVRKWLQDATQITNEVMNNSNFQTEIHEVYLDQGSFGTGIMSVEEDDEMVVRFLSRYIKNVWIDENHKGMVDTVFYCFKWKPSQIIDEFKEKTPAFVLDKQKNSPEEELELLQVVMPNKDYDSGKKLDIKGKKFVSCTYMKDGDAEHFEVEKKGFNTFPYVTPRWTKGTGEVYGRSPSMKCLPDIKMINEMMKVTIRAAQKTIDPPLLIPDNGVIGSIRLAPGALNYYRAGQGDFIKPLQTESRIDLGYQVMEDVRKRIKDCFYVDQLQLQQGPQMTATEVMQRTEEQSRLLGPILGRQHSELLRPLIERVYEIIDKRGLYPKPPRELSGRKIDVKYRSLLAKAQLATEANNITRVFQAAAPFIQLDPTGADVINSEEGVRYIANLYGLPQEIIKTRDEIEAIRQQRAEQQQKLQEAQDANEATEQIRNVTPAAKVALEAGV